MGSGHDGAQRAWQAWPRPPCTHRLAQEQTVLVRSPADWGLDEGQPHWRQWSALLSLPETPGKMFCELPVSVASQADTQGWSSQGSLGSRAPVFILRVQLNWGL